MKEDVGLWIDHRRCVIVTVTDDSEDVEVTTSDVGKQLRCGGDSPLKGPDEAQEVPAGGSRERSRTGRLNGYYETVIASIRDAESIYVIGPGEAKGELKKRMDRAHPGGLIR